MNNNNNKQTMLFAGKLQTAVNSLNELLLLTNSDTTGADKELLELVMRRMNHLDLDGNQEKSCKPPKSKCDRTADLHAAANLPLPIESETESVAAEYESMDEYTDESAAEYGAKAEESEPKAAAVTEADRVADLMKITVEQLRKKCKIAGIPYTVNGVRLNKLPLIMHMIAHNVYA